MKLLRSSITLGLALLISACASADTHPLVEAWHAGKAIVITTSPNPDNTDETYGDFAYYLNNFAASAGDHWTFFALDPQASPPKLPIEFGFTLTHYSVIFIKQNEAQGYLYPGPILEPQVYDFVQRQFEGRDIPDYLFQFSPDEVQVDFEEENGLLKVDTKT